MLPRPESAGTLSTVSANFPTDATTQALQHAWDWFALHAGQRMHTFNFFLVATAFLVAGYGEVLDKRPHVAVVIALLGAWLSLWFNRLDQRTKQLIKAGEAALRVHQDRLADGGTNPALRILAVVEAKAPGASSYSVVIRVIQWSMFVAFLLGAGYAALLSLPPPSK